MVRLWANPALVEEGDGDWEMPTIAAVGNRAFWQVLPKASGPKKTEPSLFKRATMGANDIETLWTSIGRMATAPYATGDSVVITPRTDTSSIHYQLVRVDANTGEALDTMALPTSMKPLEAGYGNTGSCSRSMPATSTAEVSPASARTPRPAP